MRAIEDITNFIFLEDIPKKSDIIFIPGGSYPESAEKASELLNKGFASLVLPSGKYSYTLGYFPGTKTKAERYKGPYETEWSFLKDVLIKNGVQENSILQEDKAESTYDNAFKYRAVTDGLGMEIKRAIICCKSFHARRCYMFYQWAYPNTEFILCPVDIKGISRESWFLSEDGIKTVMGELAKCGDQFKKDIKKLVK